MASGKTENYGLSQWEATDQVVRGDFNADNAKIDAGMAENKAAAAAAKETAENLAAVAFTPENLPFVVGTYKGNGAANQEIALGFKPSAVFISSNLSMFLYSNNSVTEYYAALCVDGYNASFTASGITSWVTSDTIAAVTDAGFRVASFTSGTRNIRLNQSGMRYSYIAVR